MVFNATFNTISVISWMSIKFICGGNQEKTHDVSKVTDQLNIVSSTPRIEWDSNSQV